MKLLWHLKKSLFNSFSNFLIPVSYTHLDVYKRQALASLQQHDVLEIAKIDNTTLA